MLAAAPLAVPLLFFTTASRLFRRLAPRTTRGLKRRARRFPAAGEASGRARPRRAAPRGPPGKEAPSAPSRPATPRREAAAARATAPVTSWGVSGAYVTPRGRCRCCFLPPPESELVSEAPQLPQRPRTSQRPPPPPLSSRGPARPGASLPSGSGAAPANGRQRPSPAAGQPRTAAAGGARR